MIFYNPYLNKGPSIEKPTDREKWHRKMRTEAYKAVQEEEENIPKRRLTLEDLEEKYFL